MFLVFGPDSNVDPYAYIGFALDHGTNVTGVMIEQFGFSNTCLTEPQTAEFQLPANYYSLASSS